MSLPHAILGVLAAGPRHGHAVARALAHLLAGIRPVNRGQVYATLRRLTRRQLVRAADGDDIVSRASHVRPYAILPQGRRELRRWLERADVEPETRCGFVERLAVLHALGDTEGLVRLVAARRAQLDALRARLERIDRLRRRATASDSGAAPATELVRAAALRLVASETAWLADVERTLAPPPPTSPDA
jgi:DNA-binding PadR family transcriptional regulator